MSRLGRLARSVAITATVGTIAWGCGAGDGTELDEYGRAYEHPHAPGLGSTYGSLEFPSTYHGITSIFLAQLCSGCHSGASARKGLDLSVAAAYDLMVDVPSSERPGLARVEPGDPDHSYLIIKLEGGQLMTGKRMPRGRPPRRADEIERIRSWIERGAPRD